MQPIYPLNYGIHLKPDLADFRFDGKCEYHFEAPNPVAEVTLNILEIAIWDCRVWLSGHLVNCAFKVNPDHEEVVIFLPEPMSGKIDLEINFQGLINDKMAGFYRSKYTYQEKTRYIAVTQFEESDARRAFPCMDHPAQKATFDITIDIDQNLVAISNGALEKEEVLDNGKKRVTFEQTPKMSTYLVFFGVGEFEFTHDKEDNRVRVVTLPGMKKFAHFGSEFGRKSLAFSESYYDIAYPLPKMDLIAIPDFAFGAMENWGAITFRENLLLYYPGITSKSGEERICEVIAHEIAHQWFGNLVTPSDWRYLWLNESFATYFGFGVVDRYYPQWETWQKFLYGQTGSSLVRDAMQETFAIEIPGGAHVVINASTAPIIYSKGGSILRQIQGYIGDDNFKMGLQHYLKTYEYDCAASHHLWESFETVSQQPISAMMKSWIEQPGFPMITVNRRGNQLVLTQQRFTYLPNISDQKWQVPITISIFSKTGAARQLALLLDDIEQAIDLDEDIVAYKVNERQTGFYRVKYCDQKNIDELGKRVREKSLAPEDRWGLQNDLYALVKSGAATLDEYLEFLSFYDREDAYLPLASMAENLYSAYLVMDADHRQKITSLALPKFETILANIGYEPTKDEDHPTSLLRDQIIWEAALYGSRPTLDFIRDQFALLMNGDAVHPDIMKSVMQAGALTGNEQVFDWFDRRLEASLIEHERMNILTAIGCFKDEGLILKTQQYILDTVPARNKFIPVVAMCSNPYAIALMWDWYVSNLDQIEQFHPLLYERVVAAIVPTAGLQRADEVKAFCDDYLNKKDKAKDVIKLSLERLEINLRMRNAQ
ncbi:MAG: M1 family metallopeptidase [Deltaproteobacteria bacterium]|jgi:tricorn protease interacting factor F2/3|nr:M1 family metallopeptidase [Deltaproteobacteria bacterium]